MSYKKQISTKVFRAIETVNILELSKCTDSEIRPILPCLVRMSLITPVDNSNRWLKHKQDILAILTGIELVNSIVALLSIDFHALEADVKREQQLRQKPGTSQNDSILIGGPSFTTMTNGGLALEYERSDMTRRLRLVLSELLFIQYQVQHEQSDSSTNSTSATTESDFYIKNSELFDNDIYVEEIADVVCIALAELPTLLDIVQISETLLHVCNGPAIICRIIANFPDSFSEVCSRLIEHGERQEQALSSSVRGAVLSMLCRMNPWQSLNVRSKCVELCRMPALAVSLSLDHRTNADSDMLPFITGLLLGNDASIRNWFAMFIRSGSKRKGEVSSTALQQLRAELLRRLQMLLDTAVAADEVAGLDVSSSAGRLADDIVVQASSLLRLYCALRGIGSIKFQDDEIFSIVQLITLHPNPSAAGVRFVSIGLCMLIACSALIVTQELERKCIEWVQWLVREEVYFESGNSLNSSFGEMLLLMAIHFHSNQLSAICELVCTTLGMKMTIRHNNMTRMKQVFTQEIFTEQVVTSHAIKVPVTHNLNSSMSGFLPIHCIHQLLRSRLFAKHNVNIRPWIYRQVCASIAPLHPVLPALLEAYVYSVVVGAPTGGRAAGEYCCKQPLTENEIGKVFQQSAIGKYFEMPSKCNDTSIEYTNTCEENLTPQLLLLYYLLLYEDMRLNNANTLITHNRKIKVYSADFISSLPIKYLLTHAQRDQSSYSALFGPLLRLLATHFPHLTLTEDWLDDMTCDGSVGGANVRFTPMELLRVFGDLDESKGGECERSTWAKLARMLQQLLAAEEAINIWPYATILTSHARRMLDSKLPRYLQELYKDVWFRLNAVLPRRLWVLTVRSLRVGAAPMGVGIEFGDTLLGKVDIADDPLQIMRCDERVFRCAPIYAIVLRVLRASLASSRSQLAQHLQSDPRLDKNGIPILDPEREDMCRTLITGQNIKKHKTSFEMADYYKRTDKRRNSENIHHNSSKYPRSESDPKPVGITNYKHEVSRYIEDYLSIKNVCDFWKFYEKFVAMHCLKMELDIDRLKMYNISLKESPQKLFNKLPVLDRHGNRIRLDLNCFERFLQCIIVYMDFEQKSKFNKLRQLRKSQKELPIYEYKANILQALEKHNVLLIAGDTGCGKSTQVPQYILEDGKFKKIVVTQPRRIACISLSKRVSYETLADYKNSIGYQIRFERTKTKFTKVIFMTEGLLLRQIQDAEVLDTYDVIILDEVHERHLHCDFLVGIMKCLLQKKTFKLILMSATINIELYANYFKTENCHVIEVPGRLYPIDIIYNNNIKDPYDYKKSRRTDKFDSGPYINILEQIDNKFKPYEKGDVLVFLNGYSEIASLSEAVKSYSELNRHWIVLQLHGSLSMEEQDKVFDYAPENCRKCIISTNIAETSVTIDGIRFVIDSGKVNRMTYDNNSAINRLKECNISRDSARQRAGRAGRTGPGYCYRLYTDIEYAAFDEYTPAEIKLVPLESLILQMVSLGLSDINNYPFVEKPEAVTLTASMERLKYCGALKLLDDELSLTALGDALSKIPVNLTIGKLLLISTVFGQVTAVFPIAALLSVQSPFTQRSIRNYKILEARKASGMESDHGDIISLLNYYKDWLEMKIDRENSRKWSYRYGLEEQRFYETTKLIDQFKSILDEAKIVCKTKIEELMTSAERSIRYGELKQLKNERSHLKNSKKSTRKVLNINEELQQEESSDIRDVEFRIKNNLDSMRTLLQDVSATSHKQLIILKAIIASALYPQIAIPDEFNHLKSDKLYHTRTKAFVFLRPECYFERQPDLLELGADDIDAPPAGYFNKRAVSNKHQLLIYQSLLETKKPYLINVMRMPTLQTLLLYASNICVNRSLTVFVFDEFLLVHCPFYGQGKIALMRAVHLRKAWETKLDSVLSGVGQVNDEDSVGVLEALYAFMRIDVRYNVKRLLPADLNVLYRKFHNIEEYTSLGSFKVTEDGFRNPFDSDFRPVTSNQFGGVQVTLNVHFDSLVDEDWSLELEQNILGSQISCNKCHKDYYISTMLEILCHEQIECIESKEPKENIKEVPVPKKSANSKEYLCNLCKKFFVFSPIEILRHKKESAAIQMLLESCMETEGDRCGTAGQQWALQEVRSMVCCYIHQVFIATPALAKLVHFQGYPSELLQVTVRGVPSMHICLDYLQELMQQPSMSKQVFAIQLLAHLSVQYALPRSLSLCAMALNLLYAMLTSASSKQRIRLFQPILGALVGFAWAFPPLIDDIGQLLGQVGRVTRGQAALDAPQASVHTTLLSEQIELCFHRILDTALWQQSC